MCDLLVDNGNIGPLKCTFDCIVEVVIFSHGAIGILNASYGACSDSTTEKHN